VTVKIYLNFLSSIAMLMASLSLKCVCNVIRSGLILIIIGAEATLYSTNTFSTLP